MRAVFVLWLLCLSPAAATTLIVDTRGASPGDGSSARPFTTIQQGLDAAKPGDTVLVRAGVYREEIHMVHGGTSDAPITVNADPIGSVIIDGADPVTGLTETSATTSDQGSVWVTHSYRSPYIPMNNSFNLRDSWTKEGATGLQQIELASRNDMVWLDGRFLQQVDSSADLRLGTFAVDRADTALYLALPSGDRPGNHRIESAVRGVLFQPATNCSYVHLRGFHFTRGAAGYGNAEANFGTYTTEGWLAQDNTADWSSWAGIHAYGSHNQLLRNVAADNGDEGIGGILHDSLLDGNASLRNNWKGIRDTFHSGGGKFTESDHVTVRHHEAADNHGPGLWFDIDNSDITVEDGRFHGNKYAGLFIEISPGPATFRGNRCWGNAGAGIVIGESEHVLVQNNICADNWTGIELRNVPDRHGPRREIGQTLPDSPYAIGDVTLRGNILFNNALSGLAGTGSYFDPARARISSDDNVYWNNAPLRWALPPTGSAIATPSGVNATLNGSWFFATVPGMATLGLDLHSKTRDPVFVNQWMDQFDAPATPK